MAETLDRFLHHTKAEREIGFRGRLGQAAGQRHFLQNNGASAPQIEYATDSQPGKTTQGGKQTVIPNVTDY